MEFNGFSVGDGSDSGVIKIILRNKSCCFHHAHSITIVYYAKYAVGNVGAFIMDTNCISQYMHRVQKHVSYAITYAHTVITPLV